MSLQTTGGVRQSVQDRNNTGSFYIKADAFCINADTFYINADTFCINTVLAVKVF